ncbi:MAG: hypothetical protein DI601_00350 [Azospirillum brasilense]|nr:MAG: hypothetical protein DI601_00350 [Azospirillum brasilense]
MVITLVHIRQTCVACPSQWDALSDHGDFIYIRYRSGYLGWGIGSSPDAAAENWASCRDTDDIQLSEDHLDGVIDLRDACEALGFSIAPDAEIHEIPDDKDEEEALCDALKFKGPRRTLPLKHHSGIHRIPE